ncbi:DUF6973 domain-containing protein [Ekhidna sp.]|uniref:DUF6973 domain-containing protein n=1 Tax=Ekhidna sp. TaxID=2608089 RepID=UPI003CCC0DE0
MKFTNHLQIPFIIAFIFFGCQENEEIQVKSITIDEVKSHFNSLPQNPKSRATQIGIEWERAAYKLLRQTDEDAILFPVSPKREIYVSGSEDTRRFSVATTSLAFAYKQDGKVMLEHVQMVPTTNSDPFTGIVTVSDWEGEAKHTFYFENGVFQSEGPADENSRLDGLECTKTHYWYCTQKGTEPTAGDPCEYGGYSRTCTYTNDLGIYDNLTTLSPEGEGGGGNTGDTSESLCPSPLDPSVSVPCNENSCPEGYGPDGNRGCEKMSFDLDNDGEDQNPCEVALIIEYPSQAYKIHQNVSKAYAKTIELFGHNSRNDCSDAFRHAYFNMINAIDVGASVAREFGEAHECDSSDELETDMDLHNNDVGINVATFNPGVPEDHLVSHLLEKLYDGELLVISNLDRNNMTTSSSNLISSSTCIE